MHKKIIITLLIINGLMEAVMGVQLFINPDFFCFVLGCGQTSSPSIVLAAYMYGIAALSMGLFSWLIIVFRSNAQLMLSAFAMYSLFHIGMCIIQFTSNTDVTGAYPHGVVGLVFVFYLLRPLVTKKAVF